MTVHLFQVQGTRYLSLPADFLFSRSSQAFAAALCRSGFALLETAIQAGFQLRDEILRAPRGHPVRPPGALVSAQTHQAISPNRNPGFAAELGHQTLMDPVVRSAEKGLPAPVSTRSAASCRAYGQLQSIRIVDCPYFMMVGIWRSRG